MEKSIFENRYRQLGGQCPPVKITPALRVNTLRIAPEVLARRLEKKGVILEKIPWVSNGYWIKKSPFSLGSTIEYLLGYYYLQGSAAQVPVEILNPASGESILDCCASPGGKATYLGQLMDSNKPLILLEIKKERLARLVNNIERLSISNSIVYNMDARDCGTLGITFDKILVDAPCSGNYTQERGWFAKRTLEDIRKKAITQKQILKAAYATLKKGGTLVYSTCSLEPEENEMVIQWMLETYPTLRLENISLDIGDRGLTTVFGKKLNPDMSKCIRFWPYKTNTEGFFIAKLRK
jgi:NOL1/NOP2/sun family putative RNA methylase